MSSAARFLLEFEATGDQEVVAKIKAVGAAGKETAADFKELQGIEDPFTPVAEGADRAIAPIEGVRDAAEATTPAIEGVTTASESAAPALTDMGGATEDLGGIFSGAGTEAETFSGALSSMNDSAQAIEGGITPAADAMGDFGESASTSADQSADFGSSVAGVSGSIVAIGGAIGGAVSAFFRYQDAQLRVQKSQNALARAQEAYRKTEENIQAILGTATSNIDGIAAANTRYVAAQAEVNRLLGEGITSGEEYDAAVKELQDSQAALSGELAKGGGDAAKLTGEMNRLEIQSGKVSTASGQVEKNLRGQNQALLESVTQYATVAGSLVQIVSGFTKLGPVIKTATGGFKDLISWIGRGGFSFASLAGAIGPISGALLIAYDAFILFAQGIRTAQGFIDVAAGNTEKAAGRFKEAWDFSKMAFTVGPSIQSITDALKLLGIDADAAVGNGGAVAESWANVGKTLSGIGPAISGAGSALGKFFTQTIPNAIKGAGDTLGKFIADLQKAPPNPLATFFTQTLPTAIQTAWDRFGKFIADLQKNPPKPLTTFFTTTLPTAIQTAWDRFGKFTADLQKNPPKPLTTFFTSTLPTAIQTAWDAFGKFTADLQKNPPKPLTTFFTQTLPNAIKTAWDAFGKFTTDLKKNPPKPLTTFFTSILPTAIQTSWDRFTGFIGEIQKTPPDAIPNWFKNTLIPGIQAAIDKVVLFFSTLGKKGATPTPRQVPEPLRQPQVGKGGAEATANTRMLTQATKENTAATNENAGAQTTLTSRFAGLNRPLTQTIAASATLASGFGVGAQAIAESVQQTEAQAAAAQKLVGPTVELNKTLAGTAETYRRITAEDVKYVAAKEEENRANIVASAGYNNANVAAIQYQQALTTMTQSLVDDTDQKNANAQATLALVDSELNAQNAIATVNEEYAQSVDKLADLNTVLGDTEAKQKAVATVANEFSASLKEQSIELQGTLQGLQSVENQEQGVANAILQTKVSLEESNQALREAKAVRDDMGASTAQLQTALNEEQTALIEEEAALQASIAAANDSVIMRQRLDNAYLEGVNSIQEWNTELATSQEAEQGAIDALAQFGITFQDLPGYMEPTIENLQLVREAQLGVGDAAEKMADMAVENYNALTSASQGFADSIKDAFLEGDIEDAVQKAFDKIPPSVRASMSEAEQETYKGIQAMRAQAEAAAIKVGIDTDLGKSFEEVRTNFANEMETIASTSDEKWAAVWNKAAELTRTGSENMMAQVLAAIEEGGGPEALLQKLNSLETDMPGIGNKLGTVLIGGVKEAFTGTAVDMAALSNAVGAGNAPAVGQQMGTEIISGIQGSFTGTAVDFSAITNAATTGGGEAGTAGGTEMARTFGEGWYTVLSAVQGVLDRIPSYIAGIASSIQPIPITADVSQAHQAIAALVTKPQTMKIPVTADVSAAHQAIAALVSKQQIVTLTYKIVTQGTPPIAKPITTTITYNYKITGKPPVAKPIKGFISYAYRITNKIPNPKEIKRFISYAYRITNKIPNPPEIKRWITYKYRVTGSRPNPPNLNRTITYRYRTVGSRPAQFGMHENLAQDTMIAAHKGERVDITPGASAGNTTRTIESGVRGTKTAGEIVIPVTLMLDNKVLIRTVRRGLVEEVSGTM